MRVLKVLPARETSNGMEQMAAPAVLFLLSEAVGVFGVPEGLQAVLLPASTAHSSRNFQAFLLWSPRFFFFSGSALGQTYWEFSGDLTSA